MTEACERCKVYDPVFSGFKKGLESMGLVNLSQFVQQQGVNRFPTCFVAGICLFLQLQ